MSFFCCIDQNPKNCCQIFVFRNAQEEDSETRFDEILTLLFTLSLGGYIGSKGQRFGIETFPRLESFRSPWAVHRVTAGQSRTAIG